jgi:quinoprotein glucose dehydrogenase
VWTQITVDEEAGLVYLPLRRRRPITMAAIVRQQPFRREHRLVDLKTGQRKWHFQLVHHPLWNYDVSSAAIIADIVVDGKPIKALAVAGKRGFVRVRSHHGKPVWPTKSGPCRRAMCLAKRPARRSHSRRSRRLCASDLKLPDDLIDFTPDMRARRRQRSATR